MCSTILILNYLHHYHNLNIWIYIVTFEPICKNIFSNLTIGGRMVSSRIQVAWYEMMVYLNEYSIIIMLLPCIASEFFLELAKMLPKFRQNFCYEDLAFWKHNNGQNWQLSVLKLSFNEQNYRGELHLTHTIIYQILTNQLRTGRIGAKTVPRNFLQN